MARQIFFRGEAGPARINVPQAPNIAGAGSVLNGRSPMGDLLRVADEGGRKIAGAVVAIAGRRMDGHVEDAYIEARRRFAEWQAGYNRTHQASQGLDAQADYALQWNKIAKDIREEYGGYLEGSWHRKLDRKLELGRLYATVDGARWQDQQYGAWGANQEKVQLSNFDRLVQGSPDDLARIQMEKAELVRAWRERNPGMDSTVFERGLDEGIAAGRVQALLARGDIDGAQAALTRYGSAGGDWNRGIAAEALRRRGTPHGGVGSGNDCSAYTGAIWKPYIADPKARQAIFGPDGGRSTSENIVQETANRTQGGRTLGNMDLAPGRVGPGMVIGLDTGQRAHDRGRRLGIDHIVSTYMGADGRLMVTESSSDKRPGGGVHDTPYEEWYARNKGHKLYGASLVPLLQGGGSPSGGYSAGGRKVYDISAPVAGAIETEAQRQGVDPAQALVICQIESSGNMGNKTGQYHGLFQLSEEDTREFGRPGDNRHDQSTNIRVGIAQWKRCLQEFGNNPRHACVAYNRGIGAAKKWVSEGADESRLPQETQAYLKKFDRYMAGMGGQRGVQPHALPAGVDQEKWQKCLRAFNGSREGAAVAYLRGIDWAWERDANMDRKGEDPRKWRLTKEEQAFVDRMKAGGEMPQAGAPATQAPQRPVFGGGILPPDKAELLQRRIDSARELQAKEHARAVAQDILAQTSGFTPEEQKAKAYALLAG
ncbi:MAG: lytic transglycosylase domain-containing protein, partial [Desulfovibrio sp.]|nr:lytic transglycosylase domain-containing protein [Desulfovibrio sp.]